MTTPRQAWFALLSLLGVALVWGSSFPLTKVLLREMSAQQFLAIRFAMAAVIMAALFGRSVWRLSRRALLRGAGLGVVFGVAQLLQTIGLQTTSATISGFITGMYVVITPICAALLLHTRIGLRAWIGAATSLIGLGILALNGVSLGTGEWLTLASALLFALQIVGLGAWSNSRDALGLAVVQIAATAVVCVLAAVPAGFAAPATGGGWLALVYMAVVSGAVAMIVQTWAQSHLPASRAAIVMSTEPAWSALFSISFLGEPLTWRVVVGGGLMFAAMLIVELAPRGRPPDRPRPEDLPRLAA